MKQKVKFLISLIVMLSMSFTIFMPAYAANTTEADLQASALKQLRLFKGVSATDFDLNRAPTRTEALVMLIRVLGNESEVLNGDWSHPFTDVASWADKYIGYAYENGLTHGISATEFGTGNANSDMYLTSMLRALGYDDSANDFVWDNPDALATSVGILKDGVDTSNFLRADVVIVSWAALESKLKDGSQTLSEKLIEAGLFTLENYNASNKFINANGGVVVSTFAEFQTAVENKAITVININSDMEIASNFMIERDDELVIYIKEGNTISIREEFIPLGCIIINEGEMIINGTFDHGLDIFINNGSLTIKNAGTVSSGMSSTYNYRDFIVEEGGNLLIERGTQFYNLGSITNNGYVSINNGGSISNESGSIINNGIVDLASYFNGKISDITGTGTINDNRN